MARNDPSLSFPAGSEYPAVSATATRSRFPDSGELSALGGHGSLDTGQSFCIVFVDGLETGRRE